jgi:Domain of unknown function (DUF4338)
VESFVDRMLFRGGCYAASNWAEVGLTQGRGRDDQDRRSQLTVKAVYVYPLSRSFLERLWS